MASFPVKTAFAVILAILLISGAHYVLPAAKIPTPELLASLIDFSPEQTPGNPLIRRASNPEDMRLPARVPGQAFLIDPANALDPFYESLLRTEHREVPSVTRIEHYGDSPTTADLITGDVRTLLQRRFGNDGPGFTLIAPPWAWYQHHGVEISGDGWQIDPASNFVSKDGRFGLGGVSFVGDPSAHSTTNYKGDSGPTEFEIWYLAQPGGGQIEVLADGESIGKVNTAADQQTESFALLRAPAPANKLEIRVDSGRVRVFGISAERGVPGVVYDSLGLNGASIAVISRMFNAAHFAAELEHRDASLIIVNYGTNEADFASFVNGPYEKELRAAIKRIRDAVPEASLMLMSPMDRGERDGLDEIHTMPTIPKIVEIQKRVAADTGCAFFNTYEAMGGQDTMAHWYQEQPRLVSADLIHPTPAGGHIVANAFVKELMLGYNRFKLRHLTETKHNDRAEQGTLKE